LVFIDSQWQRLAGGMVVPDTRVIRTFASGRVTLTRGNETIVKGVTRYSRRQESGASCRERD
jgi:hypothetical protein